MRISGLIIAATAALVFLAGCSSSHSRGQFTGHVVGKSEQDIVSRMGKPDEVVSADHDRPRWVYKKRTFDPDNFNQVDPRATILLERDAQGRLVAVDVFYG